MFTGIVEALGTVAGRRADALVIRPARHLKGLAVGESLCVSGVCLTVERAAAEGLTFRLLPETRRLTTLASLRVGDPVNLERALRVGGRLGGHLMLGHVDGQGTVTARSKRGKSWTLEVRVPSSLLSLMVPKGPIALDGVSLTLDPEIRGGRIKVHLVPHTARLTTLGKKPVGGRVNIEADLVAKYLWGMI